MQETLNISLMVQPKNKESTHICVYEGLKVEVEE